MKLEAMRKKSEKDLIEHADKLRLGIKEFKLNKATSKTNKNGLSLGKIKKELAQTLTLINEKNKETQ